MASIGFSRTMRMRLQRRWLKISLVAGITAMCFISIEGCGGQPPNNCLNCSFYSYQTVIVNYPNGGQAPVYADASGCASVVTTTPCNQLVWTGLP